MKLYKKVVSTVSAIVLVISQFCFDASATNIGGTASFSYNMGQANFSQNFGDDYALRQESGSNVTTGTTNYYTWSEQTTSMVVNEWRQYAVSQGQQPYSTTPTGSGASKGQITYIRVDSYKTIGGYIGKCPVPTPVFVAILTVILVSLILKKTALGLYIESVGINGAASRLVGLNSTMLKFITYVICGLLAGLAGIVASSRIYSADANNIGLNMEMDAILAVALGGNNLGGGKFNLMGSIIGAYTIQALTTSLYAMNVSADQLPVYKAVVVVIIVVIQSPIFRERMAKRKIARKAVA